MLLGAEGWTGVAATGEYDGPGATVGGGTGALAGGVEVAPAGGAVSPEATGVAAGAFEDTLERGGNASRRLRLSPVTRLCCAPRWAESLFNT